MRPHIKVAVLINILLSSACATRTLSQDDCTQGSWFDLGLKDGRAGKSYQRLGKHQKACSEYDISLDTEQYKEGREQGLKDYCQLGNAYFIGLKGVPIYLNLNREGN